ncbi:DNA cytosine methyltransferase, partial [Eggerthella lenta]|nr:DNA cytosine methyltransferase [Eggerthella lenta]
MHRANQDNYYRDEKNRSRFEDTSERPISSVRRLTPNECRKLQGFPSDWKYVVSDTQLYRQFGNAVSVNVS